jgi:hypothetical protein
MSLYILTNSCQTDDMSLDVTKSCQADDMSLDILTKSCQT